MERDIKQQFQKNFPSILDQICILRFGSEEKAKKKVLKLSHNGTLDENGFNKLMELLYLDKIIDVFKPLTEKAGLINLIKAASEVQIRAKNLRQNLSKEEFKIIQSYIENIPDEKEYLSLLFPGKTKIVQNKMIGTLVNSMFSTSKEKIAKEYKIDKKTLNKWLNHFFGKKFDNVKKIKFKDYLQITLKFSLRENEDKFFIGKNLEEYVLRLDTDLVHNRCSLLKIDGMDDLYYKSLKENLKLQNFDSDLKKIPYSMKEQIVDKLN